MAHFIETESVEQAGGAGEKEVWEALKQVFRHEDCLGYWHYPIFMGQGKTRKEPDILMVDLELGVMIVEVK
jgi:hypothetical protein